MKIRNRILTAVAAAMLLTGTCNMPIYAVGNTFSYAPIQGPAASSEDVFTFQKDLTMDKNACIPGVTFSYTVAAGAAIAASESSPAVKAGVGTPAIADVVYTVNESASDNLEITTSGDTKTAVKTVRVDMSNCTYAEPGIYRYIITESGTNQGVTNDSETKRTLDVYVVNGANNSLKIDGYVFYEGEKTDAPSATAEVASGKSTGFVNTYTTYDLSFGKEVTGNLGSLDKYFAFTIEITGIAEGTVVNVDVSQADAIPHASGATTVTTAANPTTLTAGTGNKITQIFYLHDGQYITIKELPKDSKYSVAENEEDYTKTEKIQASVNKTGTAYIDDVQGTMTKDIKTGYTNSLSVVTPTGILNAVTSLGFGTLLIAAGVIGLIVFFLLRACRRSA